MLQQCFPGSPLSTMSSIHHPSSAPSPHLIIFVLVMHRHQTVWIGEKATVHTFPVGAPIPPSLINIKGKINQTGSCTDSGSPRWSYLVASEVIIMPSTNDYEALTCGLFCTPDASVRAAKLNPDNSCKHSSRLLKAPTSWIA